MKPTDEVFENQLCFLGPHSIYVGQQVDLEGVWFISRLDKDNVLPVACFSCLITITAGGMRTSKGKHAKGSYRIFWTGVGSMLIWASEQCKERRLK